MLTSMVTGSMTNRTLGVDSPPAKNVSLMVAARWNSASTRFELPSVALPVLRHRQTERDVSTNALMWFWKKLPPLKKSMLYSKQMLRVG